MLKWRFILALSGLFWLTTTTGAAQYDDGAPKIVLGKPKWERGGNKIVQKSVYQQYRGRFHEEKRKRSENRKRYAHLKPGCARD